MKKLIMGFMVGLIFTISFVNVKANEISDNIFKKIVPDESKLTIKSKKATSYEEVYHYINTYIENVYNDDEYEVFGDCDPNNLTSCRIYIQTPHIETTWDVEQQKMVIVSGWMEEYEITLEYDEPKVDSEVEKQILDIKQNIDIDFSDVNTFFKVEDLSLINYYLTGNKSELWNAGAASRAIKFSNINEITKGANVYYNLFVGLGEQGEELMYEDAGGALIIYHDGYIYGMTDGAVYLKRVLYIPNDTKDTTDAYIAAAQKRINDYLKNDSVKVTLGGKLSDLADIDPYLLDSTIDIDKTDGNYYNIKVLDKTYKFYIMKTTKELEEPIYEGMDLNSKIEITSSDASIPLDSSLSVKIVENDLKDKIGTDNYKSYDISLFSSAKNSPIETLENGKFLVKIPIPEELKNKNLIIYYIATDGNIEKHEVKTEEDYAIFETNHFSVYTLAELIETKTSEQLIENKTNNPQTNDNITMKYILLFISLISIITTVIYYKKNIIRNN